jgi:phosphohistidine phosphatase SixA
MDPLRLDDIQRARATSPEERARQTLEAMRTGIRFKRAALEVRFPSATSAEIDSLLQRWLERDD